MTNIYDVTALDRMHIQEIGLFPYMLDYTRALIIYQSGNRVITKMDNRLATITPFNGLRILTKGYQQGTRFTGAEMRDVMKIIIFVLDKLYTVEDKNKTSTSFVSYMTLIKCYVKFIKMYIISRKEQFNEDELDNFEVIYLCII